MNPVATQWLRCHDGRMRILLGSVLVAAVIVGCAASNTVLVVSGDGGAGDASTTTCTQQSEKDRAALCGTASASMLFSCPDGTPPPSAACTTTLVVTSFCCPIQGLPSSDGGTDAAGSSGVNPYGVPYPTDHLGTHARSGSARGERVDNLGFQGYRPSTTTLRKVSLADLYDPDGKTHDVVFLVGGTQWSGPDQATLDSLKASTKRIATLAVLGEGTSPGQAATLTNLATYRAKNAFATTALDSDFTVLGAYFDKSAVPFVMVIDARTMEIVTAGVGGITTVSEVDTEVTAVTSRPAAY